MSQSSDSGKQGSGLSRRNFFSIVGWTSFVAFLASAGAAAARFFYPGVLFEPQSTFNAGKPGDFVSPQGDETHVIDERFKKSQRVWIIRDKSGFYGMVGVCTHLGCTPNWFPTENRFKCPCHGSNYNIQGEVVSGPAPEPLYRTKLWLSAEGSMIVTTGLLGIRRADLQSVKKYPDTFWHEDELEMLAKAPFFLKVS